MTFTFRYKGKGKPVTAHFSHDNNRIAKEGTLTQIKENLFNIGWFEKPENFYSFPWKDWGLTPGAIKPDPELLKQYKEKNGEKSPEQLEIEAANEEYKDASITRAFPSDPENEICLMWITDNRPGSPTKGDAIYNMCRSSDNRRPLHKKWFYKYTMDGKRNLTHLIYDNYEDFQTEIYPVNRDGSLDKEHVIISENKRRYGKRKRVLY